MAADRDEKFDIDNLRSIVRKLSTRVWETKVDEKIIQDWLNNFKEDTALQPKELQDTIALCILSRFLYFDDNLIREMLKTVYNDLFRRPIIHKIRKENNHTLDTAVINELFEVEQSKTRFLGMGNPSESGSHLLYYFRQINKLTTKLFINTHDIFTTVTTSANDNDNINTQEQLANSEIARYIFLDDFCGTGLQGKNYSKNVLERIKTLNTSVEICYFPLIGTMEGIAALQETKFDKVVAVLQLDESFKCFSDNSRYFNPQRLPKSITIDSVKNFCLHYGEVIMKQLLPQEQIGPMGFGDCQLLLGFHHNIPNNTLPIIWAKTESFEPVFPRHHKKYK